MSDSGILLTAIVILGYFKECTIVLLTKFNTNQKRALIDCKVCQPITEQAKQIVHATTQNDQQNNGTMAEVKRAGEAGGRYWTM